MSTRVGRARDRLSAWPSPSREVLALVGIAALAVQFRAASLGAPLWTDETTILYYVESLTYWELVADLPRAQPKFPLYALLLKAWLGIVGHDWPLVRVLSLGIGMAGIGAGYGLLRALQDRRTALYGAAALAVAPLLVRQAVEIRPYALLVTLGLASSWALVRAQQRRGRYPRTVYAGLTIALGWTHPFGWFVIAAHAVVLALDGPTRARARYWLPVAVAVGIGGAWPLLALAAKVLAVNGFGTAAQVDHAHPPTGEALWATVRRGIGGVETSVWDGVAIVAVTAGVGLAAGLRRGHRLLWALVVVPAVCLVVAAEIHPVVGAGRYLIVSAAAAILLAVRGALALPDPAAGVAAVLLVAALALAYPPGPVARQDYSAALDTLDADADPLVTGHYVPADPVPYLHDGAVIGVWRPTLVAPGEDVTLVYGNWNGPSDRHVRYSAATGRVCYDWRQVRGIVIATCEWVGLPASGGVIQR